MLSSTGQVQGQLGNEHIAGRIIKVHIPVRKMRTQGSDGLENPRRIGHDDDLAMWIFLSILNSSRSQQGMSVGFPGVMLASIQAFYPFKSFSHGARDGAKFPSPAVWRCACGVPLPGRFSFLPFLPGNGVASLLPTAASDFLGRSFLATARAGCTNGLVDIDFLSWGISFQNDSVRGLDTMLSNARTSLLPSLNW